jgi:RecA-family ATPase
MWRRIEGRLPFYGARMADLGDIRLVDLVGENSVLGLLNKGIVEPTPMYDALDKYMADFKPGMVILDVLADLFSGGENNRPQVTQFMGLLKRIGQAGDRNVSRTRKGAIAQNGTAASNSLSRMPGSWSGVNDPTGYEVGRKRPCL